MDRETLTHLPIAMTAMLIAALPAHSNPEFEGASQSNTTAFTEPDGLTFRARPLPDSWAFMLIESRLASGRTITFGPVLGVMANLGERNAMGLAFFVETREDGAAFVDGWGPSVRYRRWLGSSFASDFSVGPVFRYDDSVDGRVEGLLGYKDWFNVGLRLDRDAESGKWTRSTTIATAGPAAVFTNVVGAAVLGGRLALAAVAI